MSVSTRPSHLVRLASRDRVHRTVTLGDLTGLMKQPQQTRVRSSYLWIIPLVVGLAGILGYAKFHVVVAAWSAITSSALGTLLVAVALTVCVCGCIAGVVIWWAYQQEHRAMMIHRAAVRQYLLLHGAKDTDGERRRAA